jgi:hypothetical protein
MDKMGGLDYDPQRMSTFIYSAIKYPDHGVLREPILTAKQSRIPVVAVYTGLEAAKEMGILAVMSDEFKRFAKDGMG